MNTNDDQQVRNKAAFARAQVALAKTSLAVAAAQLQAIYLACQHDWECRYDPIHHEGYRTEGDPPGTMGVDWQSPVYVEPRTEERWTRTCKRCGKVEHTFASRTAQVQKVPVF